MSCPDLATDVRKSAASLWPTASIPSGPTKSKTNTVFSFACASEVAIWSARASTCDACARRGEEINSKRSAASEARMQLEATDCIRRSLPDIVTRPSQGRYGLGSTTKLGTWPPPEVTLARPVELRRVRQ